MTYGIYDDIFDINIDTDICVFDIGILDLCSHFLTSILSFILLSMCAEILEWSPLTALL